MPQRPTHIGVDSKTGLAHSAVVTAANVHDKHPLPDLLHGAEQEVYGDSAYSSQQTLIHSKAAQAEDCTNQRVREDSVTADLDRILNRMKSRVRSEVEHVFAVVTWYLLRRNLVMACALGGSMGGRAGQVMTCIPPSRS